MHAPVLTPGAEQPLSKCRGGSGAGVMSSLCDTSNVKIARFACSKRKKDGGGGGEIYGGVLICNWYRQGSF